ncbi:hypothetical protein [Filimonas effusa]|uniref:Uncharacterized protein n=1 Tax=Filimonas effusa TaxID=2508721 RepID=A0A4Q1DAN1_9BACT|nr:hypothetical protein [Filimonas effusa]RXK86474.1 hypothetical protein ESB13_06610 [Filimonas effusa]
MKTAKQTKMNMTTFLFKRGMAFIFMIAAITACTKTETVDAPNRITEFKISNIPEGKDPVYGAINDNSNTITAYLPFYYQLPVIIPEITVSAGAKVTPESGSVVDNLLEAFKTGKELTYTVKPTNGPERIYTLKLETQQSNLLLNELSSDAVNPVVYTFDYTKPGTNSAINLTISGKNILSSPDVNSVVLIDQSTKKEYDMKAALSVTNSPTAGVSLGVYISRYVYNSTTEEAALAKSLPDDAVYTVKVFSYSRQTTLKNPVRITKKRA